MRERCMQGHFTQSIKCVDVQGTAKTEIIKTRRMAIANGTCVSFCNQPKAQIGLPGWVSPWDNRGKCYMDGKRIQCWSQHCSIPIYLQPFTSYSEILVGNCNFFLPLAFNAHVGGYSHWNSWEKFGHHKTRIMGLTCSEDSLTI